jgi:carboxyl-terminal processing protease
LLANRVADRIFFTKNDIDRLHSYRENLDAQIKLQKTDYLNLFISIYRQRLQQADSLIDVISKRPFNFYDTDKLTIAEDTLYPASIAGMQIKLRKILKIAVLDRLTDDLPGNFKSLAPAKQKSRVDSAVTVLQKKAVSSLKRKIGYVLQNPRGIAQYIGDVYCETIASCFDPHTEFFPPEEKENFESELGKQQFQFGFRIKPDKSGGVVIDNLQPGSPAFKSGKLNKNDKFISLQWQGEQPVDVSDITLDEFASLIDASNHQKILFTVKKADGSLVQVSLIKELAAADEDDKVKSFILKGASSTVGYIYLPAFYEDWIANNDGLNGCANDVGREILKLKKENITGLILDMRYNGGGSVQEATELAGIFIDAGPVAQVTGRDDKVHVLKDIDRGTIYDGPLVILVNGYSASATELVAGSLQDYNRAVIVGSPTYGKATMQVVLPVDTNISSENFQQTHTENYLKLTVSKLYRVNGSSAQFKGVQPDVVLPDIMDAYITKEADAPYALLPGVIAPNKYYTPYPPLPVKTLAASVQTEIDTSKYFNNVKNMIAFAKQKKAAKDISLNINDFITGMGADARYGDMEPVAGLPSKEFTVQNNQYEIARLQTDPGSNDMNEAFSRQVASDAYISIAYDVLLKLKN